MNKDQVLGGALLIIGIAGIIIYGWLVFFSAWQMFVIQLTAFIAIAAVLAIIAWIGYTLATTPPPKPIEEIEKEIEKELSEIKKEEVKKEETKTN
ncbi:MAG: transcriptional regulator [Candidatus Verstraetearchaeota archaeon]|nr:transcriptional regulator [Candidatus Verstraetearchaeota archaeon]